MIIYIESNFVLEVALGQEEAYAAESMLQLATKGDIELEFPAFSLSEPFWTVHLRGKKRWKLCNSINEQFRQLQRSQPHRKTASKLQPLPLVLAEIEGEEFNYLESAVERLLQVGKPIEMDSSIFKQALHYERYYGLSPQDSIIYSAIIASLQRRDPNDNKCFTSRNWKDFRDPDIISELKSYNCVYEESFNDALRLVQSTLESQLSKRK